MVCGGFEGCFGPQFGVAKITERTKTRTLFAFPCLLGLYGAHEACSKWTQYHANVLTVKAKDKYVGYFGDAQACIAQTSTRVHVLSGHMTKMLEGLGATMKLLEQGKDVAKKDIFELVEEWQEWGKAQAVEGQEDPFVQSLLVLGRVRKHPFGTENNHEAIEDFLTSSNTTNGLIKAFVEERVEETFESACHLYFLGCLNDSPVESYHSANEEGQPLDSGLIMWLEPPTEDGHSERDAALEKLQTDTPLLKSADTPLLPDFTSSQYTTTAIVLADTFDVADVSGIKLCWLKQVSIKYVHLKPLVSLMNYVSLVAQGVLTATELMSPKGGLTADLEWLYEIVEVDLPFAWACDGRLSGSLSQTRTCLLNLHLIIH
jgi:hypothetical protein